MDLEIIKEVHAYSNGIIEVGSITLYLEDNELQFDIEEHCISGGYEFRVYLAFGTDVSGLDIEVDPKTHRVLDERLVNFIHQQYGELTQM